jgi:hypothetical protein
MKKLRLRTAIIISCLLLANCLYAEAQNSAAATVQPITTLASPLTPNSACRTTEATNVKGCFSAKGDLQSGGGCSISAGSNVLTCNYATFTTEDIGKSLYLQGAGISGNSLAATISNIIGITVTLSRKAETSRSNARVAWGTDDTTAIQNALNYQKTKGGAIYFPTGNYLHHGLNITGQHNKIYADGYGSVGLYAIAVTNPGKINAAAQTVGVDISGSQYNEFDGLVFWGGMPFLADLSPQINVLAARSGPAGGDDFAIAHVFDSDFFSTSGQYDVVLYGYEQTDFRNCNFESLASSNSGLLYLSANNSPGFISPYVKVIPPINSMTKVNVSGARTVFAGVGNLIVLDEGQSGSDYAISIRDAYAVFNGTNGVFLTDTGTPTSYGLRHITLDQIYIEGNTCKTCAVVSVNAPAWNWNINNVQFYVGGRLTAPPYNFHAGFLDGYALVDSNGNASGIEFSSPSCLGSILHLGQQEPTTSCPDVGIVSGTKHGIAAFTGNSYITNGPLYSLSGCSATHPSGSSTAGTFAAGVTGACTVTVTMGNGLRAPNGWACSSSDTSTPVLFRQTHSTPTTAIFAGETVVGDVIVFGCIGY